MKTKLYKKILDENKNSSVNPYIGAIIKRRRHSLKMTLEEATKGICCVSYLSKLEHGTITPKRYVLNEVLERLNIREENLRSTKEYMSLIRNCITNYYQDNYEYIKDVYKSITDVENIHYTDILKAFYFLVKDSLDDAEKSINNALVIKKDLETEELYACILLSALILEKREKFNEALEIVKTIEHTYLCNTDMEKIKMKLLSRIYLVLGKYTTLANTLIMYQDICYKAVDFKGIIYAKKCFCLLLALSGDDKSAFMQYESIKMTLDQKENKEFLKEIYIALKKPNELLKLANVTDFEKVWAYNLLKEKDKCKELLDKIKIRNIKVEKNRLFIESLLRKYYENDFFYFMYLKETYYPFLLERGYYEEAKEVHSKLFDYLVIEAKYKEAIKIEKDFRKIF